MPTREKIYISKEENVQALYVKLSKEETSDIISKPFRTMRDVFLAAAVLGFLNDEYKAIESPKDIFAWGTLLNEENALSTLQAIALSKSKDPNILLDDDKVATIAEGYANAGIHSLAKKILATDISELEEAAIFMSDALSVVKDEEVS